MQLPKAIFLDMDGTLLNSENNLPVKNMEVIDRLREKGVKVFVATGRGQKEIFPRAPKGFALDGVISSNGMTGYMGEAKLFEHTLPHTLVEQVINLARQHQVYYELFPTSGEAYVEACDRDMLASEIVGDKPAGVQISEWSERLESLAGGITWVNQLDDLGYSKFYTFSKDTAKISQWQAVLAELQKTEPFSTSQSSPYNVEIMVDQKNKATGIKDVLERLAIAPADILVMGDSFNDKPMFEYAGFSVAMKNAPEEMKALADDVTAYSNDEEGVYHYLTDKFLTETKDV